MLRLRGRNKSKLFLTLFAYWGLVLSFSCFVLLISVVFCFVLLLFDLWEVFLKLLFYLLSERHTFLPAMFHSKYFLSCSRMF